MILEQELLNGSFMPWSGAVSSFYEGVGVNNKILAQIISQIYSCSSLSPPLIPHFSRRILSSLKVQTHSGNAKCSRTFLFSFLSFLISTFLLFLWSWPLAGMPSWSWFPRFNCSTTSVSQVGTDVCPHTQLVPNLPTHSEAGVVLWATGGGASLLGCARLALM